ncbi:MAG TPA: hypothetical protein PKY26_03285, partial [Acetivibrio clariflavus]|nr:hypothetical protein [Acetivibrio clariflavus]
TFPLPRMGYFILLLFKKKVMSEYLGRFYALLELLIAIGGVIGSKLYGFIFDIDFAFYTVLIGCIGMIIKLLLNFMITENKKISVNTESANL